MFKIISYHTTGFYKKVAADNLVASCKKLGVPLYMYEVESLGSWSANTNLKPAFIRERMSEGTSDDIFVFVDCDARVVRQPTLFNEIPDKCDMACHFLDRHAWYNHAPDIPKVHELLSGVLLLRRRPIVMQMIDWWLQLVKQEPGVWEQKHLSAVVEALGSKLSVFRLPLEYCYIATLPNGQEPHVKVASPVITQYQVSRQVRRGRVVDL